MLTNVFQVPLGAALDALPQQVAILSQDGTVVQVNQAWAAAQSSTPLGAVLGANYLNACKEACEGSGELCFCQIYRGLRSLLRGEGAALTLEYAYPTQILTQPLAQTLTQAGTQAGLQAGTQWFALHIQALDKRVGGALISHTNVSHHKRFEEEMKRLAYSDALTGLPNRYAFFERAEGMIAAAKRREYELTLLYIDLDGFKRVNDTLGHDVGDALLVAVAARFKRQVRECDLLARLGGDEFACLIEGVGDPEGAAQVARRYAACLSDPFKLANEEVWVGVSIGVAHFPQDGGTLRTLLKRADGAMYDHKRRAA